MSDNPEKISLTADELKALDLVISLAQSHGASPVESLGFISSIAHALTHAVHGITKAAHAVVPVVKAVVPVVQAVAPIVAATAILSVPAEAAKPLSDDFSVHNATLNDLIEVRRRANLR